MSKIEFYIKYIFRTPKGRYSNWRFYFPLFGVTIGIIAVILTFATMQGMESEVFKKLELINFSSQVLDDTFVKPENDNFYFMINRKAIVSNRGEYRVINVRAVENFDEFKVTRLTEFIIHSINDSSGVVLGNGLAKKLNVSIGDEIELFSPTDVSYLTGIPTSIKVRVSGIFSLQLLNYDDQFIFTNLSVGELLFKSADKQIHSHLSPEQIKLQYKNVKNILTWRDKHIDFISAMSLEKLAFSSFGLLIILLSAFSSFSIMCVTVIKRISEIGILRTLGYSKDMIAKIYFIQSLLIGLIGGFLGILVSKIFIGLDDKFNLIWRIFSSEIIFNFKLNISNFEIFIIFSIAIIIMLFAGIYPSIYASRISILKSINYKK